MVAAAVKVSKSAAARDLVTQRWPNIDMAAMRVSDLYAWLESRGWFWRQGEWVHMAIDVGTSVLHADGVNGVVVRRNGGWVTVRLSNGRQEQWNLLATLPTAIPPKEIRHMKRAVGILLQRRATIVESAVHGADLFAAAVLERLRTYSQQPGVETQRAVYDALVDWAEEHDGHG